MTAASPASAAADEPGSPARSQAFAPGSGRAEWRWLIALFLVILGAHAWVAGVYSRPLPYWDQWDGEWESLLKPWREGHLTWAALFAGHNEHRIFLTRVVALGLFAANGQWDGYVEMAADALFFALGWTVAARVLVRAFGPPYRLKIVGAVALLGVLPFGYENTVWGFQLQFYQLLFLSLGAIWGIGFLRPGSWGWWGGLLSAALALLTLGSGFMAAAAVGSLLGLRCLADRRRPTRGEKAAAGWCAAVTVVGWLSRPGLAPTTHLVMVHSVPEFLAALGRFAAWPYAGNAWLVFATNAPLLLLGVVCLWRGFSARWSGGERLAELLLTIGWWVVMQTAAVAFARGGNHAFPSSRYTDVLCVGTLANFLAMLLIVARVPRAGWRTAAAVGGIAWLCFILCSLAGVTSACLSSALPEWQRRTLAGEEKVRWYVGNQDAGVSLPGSEDLPYPSAEHLAALLDDPLLQAVLPWSVRRAVPLEKVLDPAAAFVSDGVPATAGPAPEGSDFWGNYRPPGGAAPGAARWQLAQPAKGAYLHFFLAGYLGNPGSALRVRNVDGGQTVDVAPPQTGDNFWVEGYARSPGSHLEIVASDQDRRNWFAFSAPVEMGWLSYWSQVLLQSGALVFTVGVVLAGGPAAVRWLSVPAAEAPGG